MEDWTTEVLKIGEDIDNVSLINHFWINEAVERLTQNPFFGPNIVKLKGSYTRRYRYRVGDYRMLRA